jgi:hypothetical protein
MITIDQDLGPAASWSSLSPYVRPGDVVIARVTDEASQLAFTGFAENVAVDSPLATYVVALPNVDMVNQVLGRGAPITLRALGPANGDAVDAPTLAILSSTAHSSGKDLFISVSLTPAAGLQIVGARADFIELDTSGANAAMIKTALSAIRNGGAPRIFLRVPPGLSARATASYIEQLGDIAPAIGLSFPPGTSAGEIADVRALPSP